MEGDSGSSYYAPVAVKAAPKVAPTPAATSTLAALAKAPKPSGPTFAGGPTDLKINPMYSGGTSGTGGREGDVITTPTVLDSYYAYDPATKKQHMWDTSGKYLGVYKDTGVMGALKEFGTGFVVPALAMASGVGALGAAFGGAAGAAGSAAMAAASPAATIGSALGISSPALASAAGNAIINTVVNGGDVKKAITSAALNYGAGALSSATGAALSGAGVDPTIAKAVANAATGVVKAELTGGDPTSALISAGLSALTPALTPATAPATTAPAASVSSPDTSFPAISPDTSISGIDTGGYNPAKDISQIGTGTVQTDFNALVDKGVDPDTALATAVAWQTPPAAVTPPDLTPEPVVAPEPVAPAIPGGLAAVTAGSAPGAIEAAANQVVSPEIEVPVTPAIPGGLAAVTPAPEPVITPEPAIVPEPVIAPEPVAPTIPGGLAAVTAGSAPGAIEAAQLTSSPLDAVAAGAGESGSVPMAIGNEAVASGMAPGSVGAQLAADNLLLDSQLAAALGTPDVTDFTGAINTIASGAGESGSVPMALGNEAVASGMSPGSLGAQLAADNLLLDSQLAAGYGTPDVADLTGATDAAAKLKASANEAVASGMSPGSVGAAQGAAGMLTDAQLKAAYGTTPAPTTAPAKAKPSLASLASLLPTGSKGTSAAGSSGGLPASYTDQLGTAGKYLTVGKMGYDMTPRELKHLYADLTSTPAPEYEYMTDEAPTYIDVAALNRAPAYMPSMPSTDSPYGYATGGLVHAFAEGGIAFDSESSRELSKSLKALGEMGGDVKPSKHDLRQVGVMGTPYRPRVLPQLAALLQARGMKLAEGGQPDDHTHPNYDGVPLLRTGGLTGLGGKYVEGKGDGTSDDIAAMLANGEYVFSADVVSALGNGSNKAGAKELDHMVQAIRSRARSAPPDELPPDAKSPLEYLKSSKGKKHG